MVPRLLDKSLMPAASALNMASFNLGFTFGPLLGALAISWHGFAAAYTIDVVTFTAAYYALVRMPRMPPMANSPRAGLRSVVDGLGFLKRSPNLRMTFVLDLCAMVLAQPRALFPALAYKVYGGGAGVVGLLQAAPAAGAVVAFLFSGWVSRVRLQGLAIVVAVIVYGTAVGGVGLTDVLWARGGVPGDLGDGRHGQLGLPLHDPPGGSPRRAAAAGSRACSSWWSRAARGPATSWPARWPPTPGSGWRCCSAGWPASSAR